MIVTVHHISKNSFFFSFFLLRANCMCLFFISCIPTPTYNSINCCRCRSFAVAFRFSVWFYCVVPCITCHLHLSSSFRFSAYTLHSYNRTKNKKTKWTVFFLRFSLPQDHLILNDRRRKKIMSNITLKDK